VNIEDDQYGFRWGQVVVQRAAEYDNRKVLRIKPDHGKDISIYVSATGRSIRVYRDGKELT
jgi:hypothetical protein